MIPMNYESFHQHEWIRYAFLLQTKLIRLIFKTQGWRSLVCARKTSNLLRNHHNWQPCQMCYTFCCFIWPNLNSNGQKYFHLQCLSLDTVDTLDTIKIPYILLEAGDIRMTIMNTILPPTHGQVIQTSSPLHSLVPLYKSAIWCILLDIQIGQ